MAEQFQADEGAVKAWRHRLKIATWQRHQRLDLKDDELLAAGAGRSTTSAADARLSRIARRAGENPISPSQRKLVIERQQGSDEAKRSP